MKFSDFLESSGEELRKRLSTVNKNSGLWIEQDVYQELENIAYRLHSAANYMKRKESEVR